jgi:prolyl oligopeptidase
MARSPFGITRVLAAVAGAIVLVAATPLSLRYPATPVANVSTNFFGTVVVDPYRWLEDGKSPRVVAWAHAEAALAAHYITSQPSYAFYKKRDTALAGSGTVRFYLTIRNGRYFYERLTLPQSQPVLVARDGFAAPERVIFNPAAFAKSGPPPAVESYFVSPDGSKVAFTTQAGGSEAETLRVVDAATGNLLPDVVEHAGGGTSPTAVVWDADSNGFLHTRFPLTGGAAAREANLHFFHHVLGSDPATDVYAFGEGQPPNVEYNVVQSADGTLSAISASAGDGVHNTIYVRRGAGNFEKVAGPEDAIGDSTHAGGRFVGDALYVISAKRNPKGEIVAIGPGQTFDQGKSVLSEDRYALEGLVSVPGGFIARELDGGDSVARFFSSDGGEPAVLPLPTASDLSELAADSRGGDIIADYASYDTPGRWLRYDSAKNLMVPTGVENLVPGDYSKVTVKRVFVPSIDGTAKIPLEIAALSTTQLGPSTPTRLTAYGAYGIVSRPFFVGLELAWLERGGVLAEAMIRGGGEYGDGWHKAALHETVYKRADDLAACAAWLGANGYGDARHLGIEGGSAGGFLMGMALTRNPGAYRAVNSDVGIYDTLRWVDTPNGKYNVPEFGDPRDPKQFAWMHRYGPYYNVRKGVKYPAILMETGENDPRVDPRESRKMAARLQAASASGAPVLLWQKSGEGHGIGNSLQQTIAGNVERQTFFDSELR